MQLYQKDSSFNIGNRPSYLTEAALDDYATKLQGLHHCCCCMEKDGEVPQVDFISLVFPLVSSANPIGLSRKFPVYLNCPKAGSKIKMVFRLETTQHANTKGRREWGGFQVQFHLILLVFSVFLPSFGALIG